MFRAIFDSTYTKLIVGGIIAFGAIVGGVYVGYAALGSRSEGGG